MVCLGLRGGDRRFAARIQKFLDRQILDFGERMGWENPIFEIKCKVSPSYIDKTFIAVHIKERKSGDYVLATFRIPKMACRQRASTVKIRAFFDDEVYEI